MASRKENKLKTRGPVGGQNHPRAVLTDDDVERMRRMHEEWPVGDPRHVGYKRLAKRFECSRQHVMRICRYLNR